MSNRILVINPGSTSTKVALYEGENEINTQELNHSSEQINSCDDINDQLSFRRDAIHKYLQGIDVAPNTLNAIAARGGIVGQLETGAYIVNDDLVWASKNSKVPHASNLAAVIAYEIAKEAGVNAYIYDAVCGCGTPDEIYTITGVPEIEKRFLTHVLNSRAVAIEQAKRDEVSFEKSTYIVAHLGGGITVNLINNGKILDIVGDDEGAMSPERAGGVPCRSLVRLCYSGKYDEKSMQRKLRGNGGMEAYLGTNNLLDVQESIEDGNDKASLIYEAMTMQVAKDIGSLSTVVSGKIDKIILTGGISQSSKFTKKIIERVEFIAPVSVMAGTFEMEALAFGINRVLCGKEECYTYWLSN